MRRQECVKHRENDFRVPTSFDGVWSNLSVTNWQIPVFMVRETLLHRWHCCTALPASDNVRSRDTRGSEEEEKLDTSDDECPPLSRQFYFRFLRCFLLFHIVAPIVVVRWTEITLRCENDATTSQYVNRLYGSLQGLTIVWIMQQ